MGIKVDMDIVDRLLEQALEAGGEELMRYIDEDIEAMVVQAYRVIGQPGITLQTAWHVVRALVEHLAL